MVSPGMNRKDNVIIWSSIFLPRIMAGIAMVLMCSVPRVSFSYHAGACITSAAYMSLIVLNILSWANPKLPVKLFDPQNDRHLMDMNVFISSTVCTGILVAVAKHPSFPYSELAIFILITTLLLEAGHLYVIPAEWKLDPQIYDSFWKKIYLLVLFVIVFFYFSFVMHLLTQGYYKPCMVRSECDDY